MALEMQLSQGHGWESYYGNRGERVSTAFVMHKSYFQQSDSCCKTGKKLIFFLKKKKSAKNVENFKMGIQSAFSAVSQTSFSMLLILQLAETGNHCLINLALKDIKICLQQVLGWLWSPTRQSPPGDKQVRMLFSISFMF